MKNYVEEQEDPLVGNYLENLLSNAKFLDPGFTGNT